MRKETRGRGRALPRTREDYSQVPQVGGSSLESVGGQAGGENVPREASEGSMDMTGYQEKNEFSGCLGFQSYECRSESNRSGGDCKGVSVFESFQSPSSSTRTSSSQLLMEAKNITPKKEGRMLECEELMFDPGFIEEVRQSNLDSDDGQGSRMQSGQSSVCGSRSDSLSESTGLLKQKRPRIVKQEESGTSEKDPVAAIFKMSFKKTEKKSPCEPKQEAEAVSVECREAPHCVMAPKLKKAKIQNRCEIVSNIYSIEAENRVVYRYDVRISAVKQGTVAKTIDLCRGSDPLRPKKCVALLKLALEKYRRFREMAYAYDSCSTLFTTEELDLKEVGTVTLPHEELTLELRELLGNNTSASIVISECVDSSHQLNLQNFVTGTTRDLAEQDHSLRQFYEILTSQYGIKKNTHFVFGGGRLFLKDGTGQLKDVKMGEGKKLVSGVEKGIRFIDGKSGVALGLVVDSKKAAFFEEQPLLRLAEELWKRPIERLDPKSFISFIKCVEPYVKNLRLRKKERLSSFVATYLSKEPIGTIVQKIQSDKVISVVELYQQLDKKIREDLPAVVLDAGHGKAYFPMEILIIVAGQRVPLSKQSPSQTRVMIRQSALTPDRRFNDIMMNLKALKLDDGGKRNETMRAFGVKISEEPLKVNANLRALPSIGFGNSRMISVNREKASWETKQLKYECAATIKNFYLLFNNGPDEPLVRQFAEILFMRARSKGIRIQKTVIHCVRFEKLEKYIIEEVPKNEGYSFIMYVDPDVETHDDLKLFEALHQVVTQHVYTNTVRDSLRRPLTLENIINKVNTKNFGLCYRVIPESCGVNKWIGKGDTLVIGYDVCHPDPQSAHERRLGLEPEQPSVIGISFNGAKNPETFIGDYAYHEPRREQVTADILDERARWILHLFHKNRKKLPSNVIITRDGVSEGQLMMVIEDELKIMKSAMQDYAAVVLNNPKYQPKFTLVVATKRHNKRFVSLDSHGGLRNPLPGTVIDHTVTRPDVTEVFMQSHRVIQGTGKLPAYTMPVNEINLNEEELQSLMMALCYTHQIINSAVSIPEPIYQADEWAKRGRNVFRAMKRRTNGELPRNENRSINWRLVTKKLCYMNKRLEETRANA